MNKPVAANSPALQTLFEAIAEDIEIIDDWGGSARSMALAVGHMPRQRSTAPWPENTAYTMAARSARAAGCKDKWGVSWQITPRVLTEVLAAGGYETKRAFDTMMSMKKIDVAVIEAARRLALRCR
jgi:predicted 3-demethylubiquinone-9 3-methyltransferase (glyoxalase superfamily)